MAVPDTTDARLLALWQKVEDFSARVDRRYPGELRCAPGCSGCCDRRLTVTAVEAAAIRGWLHELDAPAREQVAARARARTADPAGPCAALDEQGRCGLYPVRPLVCRSHGVPMRLGTGDNSKLCPEVAGARKAGAAEAPCEPAAQRLNPRALPVLTVCPLNFTGRPLESVEADCVLDQGTLSTVLYAIDRAAAPAGPDRVDLAALLVGEVC